MADKKGYQTPSDVYKAFPDWEKTGKVRAFAFDLWQLAKAEARRASGDISERALADKVFQVLRDSGCFANCLTDDFRRLVIRHHARGYSTAQTVETILRDRAMETVTPFALFKYDNVCGYENIKDFLLSRMSYLKPSHPRWPEKKYGDFWRSERQAYVDQIKAIPLTHPMEQLNKLQEHYAELESLFLDAKDPKDKEIYHKCLMRTMAAIYQMSRDPSHTSSPGLPVSEETPALAAPKEEVIEIPADTPTVVTTHGNE